MTELIVRNCCLCGAKFNDAIRMRMGELIVCPRCAVDLPSPGLEPPRPAGCPSCAQAEAEVDRLKAALDLEAKARYSMAEGLAEAKSKLAWYEGNEAAHRVILRQAKEDRDRAREEVGRLIPLVRRLAGLLDGIGDEERAALSMAAPYLQDDSPAIRAEDLVEALDDDPEPRGWDEGHDTPEERDGER